MKQRFSARVRRGYRWLALVALVAPLVPWLSLFSVTDGSAAAAALSVAPLLVAGSILAWALLGRSYEVGSQGLTVVRGPFRRRLRWTQVVAVSAEADGVLFGLSNGQQLLLTPRDPSGLLDTLRSYVRTPAPAHRWSARTDHNPAGSGPAGTPQGPGTDADPATRCPQCGAARPLEARFCPTCGADARGGPRTAGLGGRLYELATFRRRLGAFGIDWVLAGVAYQVFTLVVQAASEPVWIDEPAETLQFGLWDIVIPLLGTWIADAAGWTPGKALVGLRVLREDGHRPGPVHGLVRSQARIVSAIPFALGYFWVAWDARKQAWHDKFASTYVVRVGGERSTTTRTSGAEGRLLPPLVARRSAVVWFPAAALLAVGSVIWIYSMPALVEPQVLPAAGLFNAVHPLPPAEVLRDASVARPAADEGCPGRGRRICIIPVGDASVTDADALAAYLSERYEIPVGTLPAFHLEGHESFSGEFVDESRQQLDGHGVLLAMRRHYPNTLASSSVVVIGVTAYDMFSSRDLGYHYLYSTRDPVSWRLTLVSTARIEPVAWGDEADESLRMERVRKIVAREVGALYYRLSPSEDPRSVMQAVLSPLARLDHVDEGLPLHELEGVNPDLIANAGTWEGRGGLSTAVFELGEGEWEYCATNKGAIEARDDIGLRVTAYTEDAEWVASSSGAGRSGSLGCAVLTTEPGRFFFRIRASAADVGWSLTARRSGALDQLSVRTLHEWDEFPSALAPSEQGDEGLVFESVSGAITQHFWSPAPSWSFCWEVMRAGGGESPRLSRLLEFTVTFEDDLPVGESRRITDAAPGGSGCIEVEGPAVPGRYRLYAMGDFAGNGWRVTIPGAQLD